MNEDCLQRQHSQISQDVGGHMGTGARMVVVFCLRGTYGPSLEGPFLWKALDVTAFAPDIGRARWGLLGRQRSVSGTVQRPI
jgi:hypothetical protein